MYTDSQLLLYTEMDILSDFSQLDIKRDNLGIQEGFYFLTKGRPLFFLPACLGWDVVISCLPGATNAASQEGRIRDEQKIPTSLVKFRCWLKNYNSIIYLLKKKKKSFCLLKPRLVECSVGGGSLATQSCLTLVTPWTVAHHGLSQSSILEWVTISFSRRPTFSALQVNSLPLSH